MTFGNKSIFDYNRAQFRKLEKTINCINANHNIPKSFKIKSDEFGGLESVLYICEGAHVMLTRNIWLDKGLCNGSMGIVKDINYNESQCP